MTEWLKVRAWKVRIPQKGIASSNLAFSAETQAQTLFLVEKVAFST